MYAIAISGNDVYTGGVFDDAGGNPNADDIARLLIENLSARSSPELRRDLDEATIVVDLAETCIGQDVHVFWDAIRERGQP